jgi:hypothetical protein
MGSSAFLTAPSKKKSSIFGVANLIRKVNVSQRRFLYSSLSNLSHTILLS